MNDTEVPYVQVDDSGSEENITAAAAAAEEDESTDGESDGDVPKEKSHKMKRSIDDILDDIAFGPFQLVMSFICGAGWFFDGMELSLVSFILPKLKAEWNLGPIKEGLIGSCVFLGMMIGAQLSGLLSDRLGRKKLFVIATFTTTVFGFASAAAPEYYSFVALRLIVGIGLGASIPVDFSLLMEFTPTKARGPLLSVLNIYSGLGAAVESLAAYFLMTNANHWRILIAVSAAPGIFIFLSRLFVPESPRWYLSRGDVMNSKRVLSKMAKMNGKPSIENIELVAPPVDKTLSIFTQFFMLFNKEYAMTTMLLWVIWFLLSFGSWGFSFIMPIVFTKISNANPYLNTLYVIIFGGVGCLICLVLIERVSRKLFLCLGFIITGVITILCSVSKNVFFVVGMSMLISLFSTFPWAVIYTYTPEVYPTACRATGMGFASTCTRIAGTITPVVGVYLLTSHYALPFIIYGAALVLAGFLSILLPKETQGKRLVDIVPANVADTMKKKVKGGISSIEVDSDNDFDEYNDKDDLLKEDDMVKGTL